MHILHKRAQKYTKQKLIERNGQFHTDIKNFQNPSLCTC